VRRPRAAAMRERLHERAAGRARSDRPVRDRRARLHHFAAVPLKLPGGPARLRIASVVLAVVALLALRLPTNIVPILNVDEADFAVESGVLLDGGRPYVDFVEKKPPLIYVLYAGGL